jgi:hypothetical protein
MHLLQNWLMHGTSKIDEIPLIEKLPGIDILYQNNDN